jgi:hypothetical protein
MPLELLLFSTKASPLTGWPSLNSSHVFAMKEASETLQPLPLPVKRSPRFIDRTGKVYARLTVVGYAGPNRIGQSNWICDCECGTRLMVFGGNLHSGHTLSCGCLLHDRTTKHGEGGRSEGNGRSREYQALACILQRCLNPNHPSFKYYGERGITVCEDWNTLEKFPAFLAHVGRRPSKQHSIDRWPDKNGNYEPGNVRWATAQQQQSNKRNNVYVTYQGDTLCMRAMARKHNVDDVTFGKRIRDGWTVDQAITTPCPPYQRRHASI